MCGWVRITGEKWDKGAKGTRAHGAQRQALAAGTSEGPAPLRPPGGDKLQILMHLNAENTMLLKVQKFVTYPAPGHFETVSSGDVKFIGYGMPLDRLAAYRPLGSGNVILA